MCLPKPGDRVQVVEIPPGPNRFAVGDTLTVAAAYWTVCDEHICNFVAGDAESDAINALSPALRERLNLWVYLRPVGTPCGYGAVCRVAPLPQ